MSGWGAIHDRMMSGLQTHGRRMATLQEQVATGSRIIRPSDGPTDTHRIMSLESQSRSLEAYDENISRVVSNLEQSGAVLQDVSNLLVQAKTLLVQVASETYTQVQRDANGEAINQLLTQAVWLANTEVLGQRLFSGDDTNTPPYAVEETDGRITAVNYQGGSHTAGVPVAPGVEHASVFVGSEAFGGNDRRPPLMLGDTGAVAGSGTSTVSGDTWLTVMHDTTSYGGATGVQAGTSSAGADTIVGLSHTLTIDADNNKIKLDDGGFVTYGSGGDDANIMVTNAAGDIAYVDVTTLVGGLSGVTTVPITATAKLSIDDLGSTVDVTTFDANEAIINADTGKILYVNASELTRVGLEPVRVPGSNDVFEVLIAARDLLTNEQGLTRREQTELISESVIESLDEVIGSITANTTAVGGRLQAVATLQNSVADIKAGVDMQRSELQDADIVQLATDLARTQAFYEMVLASSAKVLRLSLLDYL
jgi:flagellar hook-associated protein 3 FlgL